MSSCDIDHAHTDVVKKFEDQKEFLPEVIAEKVEGFLTQNISQIDLNELFHLLKKYDLADGDVRRERDEKISALVNAS